VNASPNDDDLHSHLDEQLDGRPFGRPARRLTQWWPSAGPFRDPCGCNKEDDDLAVDDGLVCECVCDRLCQTTHSIAGVGAPLWPEFPGYDLRLASPLGGATGPHACTLWEGPRPAR
jgi:hypothetical protein